MALSLAKIILFSFLVAAATVHLAVDAGDAFYSTTSKLKLGSEKLTHFHFYIHDIADAPPTPTAVKVAGAPGAAGESPASFGSLYVIDDAITSGPNLTASEIVGRAQGTWVVSQQDLLSITMDFNVVFTQGKFNGSVVTISGRNAYGSLKVRELPVVGGSGALRFARGYLLVQSYQTSTTSVNAIIECDLYVLHY